MSSLTLVLVLIAAFTHATWNLVAKRADDKLSFLWASAVATAVLFCPLGLWLALAQPVPPLGWVVLASSALLEAAYFWSLSQAYRYGDLALVYPVARGTAPLLVPLLAALFLGERLSPVATCGILLVALGIVTAHLPVFGVKGLRLLASSARQLGTRYALLTGLIIASYSTVDKLGVSLVYPALYNYLLFAGLSLALLPLLRGRQAAILAEWRRHRQGIVAVGVLSPLTYGLVLVALTQAPVSYVAPAREISVVIAAVMGIVLLHEPYGPQRIAGSALIAAGLVLLAVG